MRILIAGAGGQLGRVLAVSLAGHDVFALGHPALDITDVNSVAQTVESLSPDLIINAAAFNDVDAAEKRRAHAYQINALGPRNLGIVSARAGIPIVHFSTDYVFDGTSDRPYIENDLPNPLSVYGESKLQGEMQVAEANHRHYVVRTSWLYHHESRNFLTRMREIAIASGKLRIVHDQYSSPTYVPHLARAVAELIESRRYGIWHLAGRGVASRLEMVEMALAGLGIVVEIERVSLKDFPADARRPAFTPLTSAREPRIELPEWQEGIAEFVRTMRS